MLYVFNGEGGNPDQLSLFWSSIKRFFSNVFAYSENTNTKLDNKYKICRHIFNFYWFYPTFYKMFAFKKRENHYKKRIEQSQA